MCKYKDNSILSVAMELGRCRELKKLIDEEQQKIEDYMNTYYRLKGSLKGIEIDESIIDKLSEERDSIINKYLSSILTLGKMEREIIIGYYIDCSLNKILSYDLNCTIDQINYAKKKALEKLAAF